MHHHRSTLIEKTIAHTVVEFQRNSKAAKKEGYEINIKDVISQMSFIMSRLGTITIAHSFQMLEQVNGWLIERILID